MATSSDFAAFDRTTQLRLIANTLQGVSDDAILSYDEKGRLDVRFSYTSYLLPSLFYPILTNHQEIELNEKIRKVMQGIFGIAITNRIWGDYSGQSPLTVRSVKELLVAIAMPCEDDLEWIFDQNKTKNFESTGRKFSDCVFKELRNEEYNELIDLLDPLSREETFCFGQSIFPAHSEGYGATHEGRERLVSVIKLLAETKLSMPRTEEALTPAFTSGEEQPLEAALDSLSEEAFFDTFLKRCIGRDTPKKTVYRTPYGIYSLKGKKTDGGCKVMFLSPMDKESTSQSIVVFLPTQLDMTSFRQNLYEHIGARAVFDIQKEFADLCDGYGITKDRPAIFAGYSLGGIQAYLLGHFEEGRCSRWFMTSNPGLDKSWDKQIIHKHIQDLWADKKTSTLSMCVLTDDNIPNYGEVKPFSNIQCYNEDTFPYHVRFTIISPKHRKEEKYYRANLFDTLAGAIRSFYGPHSVTPFISHRDGYKVSIIDNRSERGVSDLSSHSQNRFLRLETLVRKRIAEFFSKVQSHEDTCEDKFNTLYPRPRSPMSSPVDTHAGLWASQ